MSDIKKINISEFRKEGYLQELNRKFLHPLGLALSITIDDDGNETLDSIFDYRDDPEGIEFDLKNSDVTRIDTFLERKSNVEIQYEKNSKSRIEKFGDVVEPIPRRPLDE